jgi:hypothetical protein
MPDIRLFAWSIFLFVAWLVAAHGWVRPIAIVWLAYPAFVLARFLRRRRRDAGMD